MCVCVCVCVCARAHARVCVCVCAHYVSEVSRYFLDLLKLFDLGGVQVLL